MQSPVQEPARFPYHTLFARVFVESLSNVAIAEQHHIHVVLVPTALGLHHFLHRRAAVHGMPLITAFQTQQQLHLPVRQLATLPALVIERILSSVLGPESCQAISNIGHVGSKYTAQHTDTNVITDEQDGSTCKASKLLTYSGGVPFESRRGIDYPD